MNREDLLDRLRPNRRAQPPRTPGQPVGAQPRTEPARSGLTERRDKLAREFVGHQWDLGGMAYEMASRDHFRLDVLQRHAAKLQEIDAELSEIERQLKLEDAGAGGTCPSCGALHARGAAYCWQCGNDLMEAQTVSLPTTAPPAAPPQAAPAAPAQPPAAPFADPAAPQPAPPAAAPPAYAPPEPGPPPPDPVAMPAQGVPAQPLAPAWSPTPEEPRQR